MILSGIDCGELSYILLEYNSSSLQYKIQMQHYFGDESEMSKNADYYYQEALLSNSTLESNPINQLRKLEEVILNMFTVAKNQMAHIYQKICGEISRLIRSVRYGKNHTPEFIDSIYEIRELSQQIISKLPINISKILLEPEIFNRVGGGQSQPFLARRPTNIKLSHSQNKRRLKKNSALSIRNRSLDNSSRISSERSHSNVKSIKINHRKQLKNLQFLEGQWDDLEDIDLSNKNLHRFQTLMNVQAPVLRKLNFSSNRISDLESFKGAYFPQLLTLNLSSNKLKQITGLEQTNFPSLQHLDLSHNFFSDMECLSECSFPSLIQLNVSDNRIKSIGVLKECQFRSLEILNIDGNELISIESLGECKFPALKVLSFASNNIMSLKFLENSTFKKLIALIGNNNSIKYLGPLLEAKLPNITRIILHDNKIQDIRCLIQSHFTKLRELDLENNQIKRQEMGCFITSHKGLSDVRKKYPFIML